MTFENACVIGKEVVIGMHLPVMISGQPRERDSAVLVLTDDVVKVAAVIEMANRFEVGAFRSIGGVELK